MLSRDHHGPRAVLNTAERLANGYMEECDRIRKELAIAESQLRDYQANLGKHFPQAVILAEMTDLRDRLKSCLSGAPAEATPEERPTVADLAERIHALKSSNADESPLNRTTRSRDAAEEPITSRIRRRMEAVLAIQTDASG